MDKIYLQIWELAKPYYQKGRSYDIPHIEWMMEEANKIADLEKMKKDLLLPIVILHDVGYSKTNQKEPNLKDKKTKAIHMKEGSKIADGILKKVNYNKELSKKIVHYISVHDNWVFRDDSPFKECKEMALFNDLDFLWATKKFSTFETIAKSINMSLKEFYEFWSKQDKLIRRPFCCDYTKEEYSKSMRDIKTNIQNRF
jgi:hypothetical protein